MQILDGKRGLRCDETEYLKYTHKRCPKCSKVKVVTLFYRKLSKTARGWAWDSMCIDCRRSRCRAYARGNKDRRNQRLRQWRKKNPEAARRNDYRGKLKSKYRLTPEEVEAMMAAQSGRCGICERDDKRLFIDHCHTKGHVRSLICQTCNTFLGWYEKKADTIVKFQAYIQKHSRK